MRRPPRFVMTSRGSARASMQASSRSATGWLPSAGHLPFTGLDVPAAEGVPMHFMRTDIAGNISKRFSASGLRLPRYGSACPRWIVHHAFATPGRIVSQIVRLPDGDSYLLIAQAGISPPGNGPSRATMVGAAIAYARHFVYADGLDVEATAIAVPVGITCRQCPRENCGERAFERIELPGGAPPPPVL